MPFTGVFGTPDSRLGNLVFGLAGDPLSQSVSDTLVFSQTASAVVIPAEVVAFTGIPGNDSPLAEPGQFVPGYPAENEQEAGSSLTFTHTADARVVVPKLASGSNTLAFSQDAQAVKITPKFKTADNSLTFSQEGDETDTPATFADADNSLTFTQEADATDIPAIFADADNSLTFTQTVGAVGGYKAQSSLTLTGDAGLQATYGRAATQSLTFVQTAAVNVVKQLSASDTLDFTINFTVPVTIFTHHPVGYVRPTARAVVVGPKCDFTLNVPAQAILLRCPEFGDSEAGTGSVNVKKSMTGLTYAYARRSAKRHLKYSFLLGRQKALELEDFLTNHGTEVMRLENHKGEVWLVTCLSQPYEFKANSRWLNDEERLDVSLEFEGVKVAG
jgi:hypothetical protein